MFEPLPARARNAILFRIPSAQAQGSWESPTDLSDGDRIEYQGKKYYINELHSDIHRGRWPYYTAILSEQFGE